MKQHNRENQAQQPLPPWASTHTRQGSRRVMNRIWRRLILLILALFVLASVMAGLAAWKPWIMSWSVPVLRYQMDKQLAYQVILRPDAIPGVSEAPSDAFYLDELVAAIRPDFLIRLSSDRPVNGQVTAQLKAVIQCREPGDNQPVLLQIVDSILDDHSLSQTEAESLQTSHAHTIELDPYRERAAAIAARLEQTLDFELLLLYSADFSLDLPGGPVTVSETTSLLIPLNQAIFSIGRDTDLLTGTETVHQQLHYRVHISLFPWPVFLAAAILSLASLLLLLTTTSGRPKDPFRRNLRRMKRKTCGRLILIGDKAWDPAWCVKVTDFRNMARTARKLKHPVFCYVDDLSAWPAAYFYTYYGENNYCHIYTEYPDLLDEAFTAVSAETEREDEVESDDATDFPMPVLPESDEMPPGGKSSEIRISRPARPLQTDDRQQE